MSASWKPPAGATVEVLYGGLSRPTMVALVRLDPRARWPEEVHDEHEEHVEVLAGAMALACGPLAALSSGETRLLTSESRQRSIASIGAGCPHTIVAGDSGAEYLSVMRRK